MDREKIIDFLQHISLNAYEYMDANNEVLGYPYLDAERIADDALALLKEQEAEIRQLRLALDIAKGTCKGIKSGQSKGW